MSRERIDDIIESVKRLSPDERVALADAVDRLAWRDRVQSVLDDISRNLASQAPPGDAEIDAIVDEVRAEKSLYERYWTRRRR